LKNLKIRSKLIIGFLVVSLFAAVMGLFGVNGVGALYHRIHDTEKNLIPSITQSAKLDHHTQQHRRTILNYILEKDPSERKKLALILEKEETQAKETLALISGYNMLPEERLLFSSVSEGMDKYFIDSADFKKRIDAGVNFEALEKDNERLLELFASIENLNKRLLYFNVEEASAHFEASAESFGAIRFWMMILLVMSLLSAVVMTFFITASIANPINFVLDAITAQKKAGIEKEKVIDAISSGDFSQDIVIQDVLALDDEMSGRDEAGKLLKELVEMSNVQYLQDMAFVGMTEFLRHNHESERRGEWIENGKNGLNSIIRNSNDLKELASSSIAFLSENLKAGVAMFYLYREETSDLFPIAGYAISDLSAMKKTIHLGDGLTGQAAMEKKKIQVNDIPATAMPVKSALGESLPSQLLILPLLHNNALVGLLEFGTFTSFGEMELEFMEDVLPWLSVAVTVHCANQTVHELLEQSQSLAEELRVQQEELQQTNEELEERAQMLEQQKEQIRVKNRDIESASHELELRAEELERVSRYKSQFLANMSHELRTPLNSMMILSSLLKDNREGNLTDKQVEFAATINGAGRDLLNLINDILDLSKIEAGKLEFNYEDISIEEICLQLQAIFIPIAADKGIDFYVNCLPSTPERLTADGMRIQQILKNLISNACKFTSAGDVRLQVSSIKGEDSPISVDTVVFDVVDSGIGIPLEKQGVVFEAFQQVDGSTSRKYGGTGLGLSISRQLARSMGGEIVLQSVEGEGSSFTLYLPMVGACSIEHPVIQNVQTVPTNQNEQHNPKPKEPLPTVPIPDDRDSIKANDKSILIIEDDLTFAKILLNTVQGRGFAGIVAADGESGIALAERYLPNAIILDVMLPHIDGWGVMRSLKDNPVTRHIPVHFMTCLEERQKAMSMGAIGYATKPVNTEQLDSVFSLLENAMNRSMKMLLIVEDDQAQASAMVALLNLNDVTITVAESGRKAIALLTETQFDCIVLDLGLADMGAYELLEELKKLDPQRRIPVIIHTGRELSQAEDKKLRHYAESIIIKGAKSPERLLNEVTLFLHLVETSLEPDKQRMIRTVLDTEAMLAGKKILIVDDDMRNIFSLSSALSEKELIVLEAENGVEALKILDANPDMDLVLMDIMMPVMDGYETMRNIRKDLRFQSLPIIALTAKAMKGDREECLDSGASDYIPKPVDIGKLFSLLRVWLYKA